MKFIFYGKASNASSFCHLSNQAGWERLLKKQTLLVMKLVVLLLTITSLQLTAKSYAQQVTLRVNNASLGEVFEQIYEQTGYQFVATKAMLNEAHPVSMSVENASVKEVLNICFKNQPLTYLFKDKVIIIKEKTPLESKETEAAMPPPIHIQGTVSDSTTGRPLVGVTIQVKGSTMGTTTGVNGGFSLDVSDNAVLLISYLGYLNKEIHVNGRTEIDVKLSASSTALDQLVVIGYGTQKKSDLTGSIDVIGNKDFTKGVTTNALQLMSGRAAGVQINQASAAPGGGIRIQIRGAGSINSSNAPLIVIDGMPAVDPSSIDPNDIQSIEVLKDASASAIYGSRAANGVVLITTKQGSKGTPKMSYSAYVGVQSPSKILNVLNATQYMKMVNTLATANGQATPYTVEQINTAGKGTNWQNEIFRSAMVQNHTLAFSGASNNSNYYVSFNYLNQGGIVKSSNYKKYGARLNYGFRPIPKLNVNMHLELQKGINNEIPTSNSVNEDAGPINAAIEFDPTIGTQRDSLGNYSSNPSIALNNPLALINTESHEDVDNRMYGTIKADYSILPSLIASLRLGYDADLDRIDSYEGRHTINGTAASGIAGISSSEYYHWLSEFLITYNKTFDKIHQITILGGTTFEDTYNRSVGAGAQGFPTDILTTNLLQSGNPSLNTVNSFLSNDRLNSFLGRVNYSLYGKYLLTASIRADGTSKFSDKNKYAIFPAFALGWRIIDESFMRNLPVFSDLKLRASYGEMGNQAISDYQTLQTFATGGSTVINDQVVTGVQPTRVPNPNLKWETTAETDIGIDFGLFNQRISGSIEYYNKNTRDQLFSRPLPRTTGFTNELVNFGNVVNKGFDILINSENLSGRLKWSTTLAFSTLKNTVTKLPDFVPTPIIQGSIASGFTPSFEIVQVGYPIDAYYGYKIIGIFQQNSDISHSAQPNAQPGHPIFKDVNKNGKIDPGDRMLLGSPFPKYIFGLSNDFSYKRFDLNFLITSHQGVSTLDQNVVEALYPINTFRNRLSEYWLDRWTPSNPSTKYPSGLNPVAYGGALSVNSLDVVDASYVRLQTVSLSYNIPISGDHALESILISISGDNLLTLTKFSGYNPDADDLGTGVGKANYNSYPLGRTIRLGVNVNF
ncbi:MAG: SusC/RagA family TonB-linked outer membrane protein [Chitinophagaceae bacterium]|nr:MAG: SusC/RagA family TonB-linked outer membrane protein [Chitinophagaceae bacterium]